MFKFKNYKKINKFLSLYKKKDYYKYIYLKFYIYECILQYIMRKK